MSRFDMSPLCNDDSIRRFLSKSSLKVEQRLLMRTGHCPTQYCHPTEACFVFEEKDSLFDFTVSCTLGN